MYPLQTYWHIIAISFILIPISLYYELSLFIWLFFIYLSYEVIHKRMPVLVLLLCLLSSIGYYFYLPKLTIQQLDEKEITLEGTVTSNIHQKDSYLQFIIEANKQRYIINYFYEDDEFLSDDKALAYKSICHLKGTMKKAERPTNPYEFDYPLYLAKNKINYVVQLHSLNDLTCEKRTSILSNIYRLRQSILESLTTSLSHHTNSWIHALFFGEKSFLEEETIDLFQRWAISHILAISGLHVGIIASFTYFFLLISQMVTKEKATIVLLSILPLYIFLSGAEPSVWRATCMIILFILLHKKKKQITYTDMLSLLFILFILIEPYIIYHIGFQFSFAVTFALIVSSKLIQTTSSPFIQALQISFVAQMFILPLQIQYFSIFQPLSIILNILIIPYFTLFVMPILASIILSHFFSVSFMTILLDNIFVFIHEKILAILYLIDTHWQYPLFIGTFSPFAILIYYTICILLLVALENKTYKKAMIYGCAFVSFVILLALRPYLDSNGYVTMLDIGQGDAFVIELPYRKGVFIVDAGSKLSFDEHKQSKTVYQQIIRPYLYGRGIHHIDAIFISHEHVDHDGSIPFILEQFDVDKVITSAYFSMEDSKLPLDNKTMIDVINTPKTIQIKGQVFHLLGPLHDRKDANSNSLLIYTKFGPKSWLFTGDMVTKNENEIMEAYPHLKVDILKVAHHGSETSTSEEWLSYIKPSSAWIPVGRNNRYNHPSEAVVERLLDEDLKIYRTDINGAVQYRYNKQNYYEIQPFIHKKTSKQ